MHNINYKFNHVSDLSTYLQWKLAIECTRISVVIINNKNLFKMNIRAYRYTSFPNKACFTWLSLRSLQVNMMSIKYLLICTANHRSHVQSAQNKADWSVILTSAPLGPGIPACPGGPCCNQKKNVTIYLIIIIAGSRRACNLVCMPYLDFGGNLFCQNRSINPRKPIRSHVHSNKIIKDCAQTARLRDLPSQSVASLKCYYAQ